MKISPSFTHPQAILGVNDFLLSDEHILRYINKYPEHPSFIMAMSDTNEYEDEESASIHIHPS